MRTCFVDPSAVNCGKIVITDISDIGHIVNVLRKKRGDLITVSDGTGRKYTGIIEKLPSCDAADNVGARGACREAGNGHNRGSHVGCNRGSRGLPIGDGHPEYRIVLSIEDVVQYKPVRTRITLYQCVPKHGKMEVIIQKATELGIEGFVPVFSERSVPKKENPGAKMKRWTRVAEEASKQSGRDAVPFVKEPLSFSEAASDFGEFDLLLFPYENEKGTTIKDVLTKFVARTNGREGKESNIEEDAVSTAQGMSRDSKCARSGDRIALIIGPEGGFTENEAEIIRHAGGMPCSLGGTILRTETASLAAIAMTLYELEL